MAFDLGEFEEEYLDVLQNIEFGIVRVYREHPEMTDWEARSALQALLREYQAEVKGRSPRPASLNGLSEEVYYSVRAMCEWRLGRENTTTVDGLSINPKPITLNEMVDCLKRVRKSIDKWTRRGGRQGYLTFVDQYIS